MGSADMFDAGDDSGEDEAGVFPQTHIVIKFASHINASAMMWLVDKIRGKRRDGGAELLVRRQPRRSNEVGVDSRYK